MAHKDPLVAVLQLHLKPVAKPRQLDEARTWAGLGYEFADVGLLRQALSHGSSQKLQETYERLEFLGDRVLSLVIAEQLFKIHATEREGRLSARHSSLVRGEVCADIAEKLGVADMLHMGSMERKQGVHKIRSVLGDVMEALIGAVYLDGGMEAARRFVMLHWQAVLANPDSAAKDAKTFVQEWALARGKALPLYELVGRVGPEHRPEFTVKLTVLKHGQAEGRGATKQAAEMSAAQDFIVAKGLR